MNKLLATIILILLAMPTLASGSSSDVTQPEALAAMLYGPDAAVGTPTRSMQDHLRQLKTLGHSNVELDRIVQQFLPAMAAATYAQTVNKTGQLLQRMGGYVDRPWPGSNRYQEHSYEQRGQNAASRYRTYSGTGAGCRENNSLWFESYGYYEKQPLHKGFAGYTTDGFGFLTGFDTTFLAGKWTLGFGYNYTSDDLATQQWTTLDGVTNDPSRVNTEFHTLLIYSRIYLSETFFLSSKFGGSSGDIAGQRLSDASSSTISTYSTEATNYLMQFVAGYDLIRRPNWRLMPRAAFSYFDYSQEGYIENGTLGDVAVGKLNNAFCELNVVLDFAVRISATTELLTTVGYRSHLGGDSAVLRVQSDGLSFNANGIAAVQEAFLLDLGGEFMLADGFALALLYNLRLAENSNQLHAGTGSIVWEF